VTQDIDILYAAVYANPADDGPRLVLADALQQLGDPRGELIALQRARKGKRKSPRERELFDQYARTWLGEIDPMVLERDFDYARGFLSKCALREVDRATVDKLGASPVWRTVEDLDAKSLRDHVWRFVGRIPLRILRGVRTLDVDIPTLEELVLEGDLGLTKVLAMTIPKLRALTYVEGNVYSSKLDFDLDRPLIRQLDRLEIQASRPDWIPLVQAIPKPPRELFLTWSRHPWRLRFTPDTVTAELTKTSQKDVTESLARLLARIDPKLHSHVEIPDDTPRSPELDQILRRFMR
jgi:uncharacterized protein (TIGR02996 family)